MKHQDPTKDSVQYGHLTHATPAAVEELNALIEQMSRTPRRMDLEYLERVVAAPGALIVARDGERIVGCVQVSVVVLLSKVKGWIDELVVDQDYRGQGLARRLMEMSIEYARGAGCKHVNLSSGVERESAHAMYEAMGFHRRESLQFRLDLELPAA